MIPRTRLHRSQDTPEPPSNPGRFKIYFSILQRKVLTPADATSLDDLAANILAFQAYYQVMARPFEWKFTRADLAKLLQRLASKDHGQLLGAPKYITEFPCQSTKSR
jgi:hypothetical protein